MSIVEDELAFIRNIADRPNDVVAICAYIDWLNENETGLATCTWCKGTGVDPVPPVIYAGVVHRYIGPLGRCFVCHGVGQRSNGYAMKARWFQQLVDALERERAEKAVRI